MPKNWKILNVKHNFDNSISCDKIFTTNWVSYNIIDYESFKDVTIRTEMPVLRILTAGSGPRRIDICIINNHNKDVVIIENKLNNAQEQQCQLADYNAGLPQFGIK